MTTRNKYQTTGVALLLLAMIWLYTTIDFSADQTDDIIYTENADSNEKDTIVVTHLLELVPLPTEHGVVEEDAESKTKSEEDDLTHENPSTTSAADTWKQSGTREPADDLEPVGRTTLISYAYSESESARENLKFFLSQGLHGAADFIFILNGETNVSTLIPEKHNIKVISRPNECFDLGAHGEVLRKDDLWKNYTHFITMNASIRGPFMPYWTNRCWSDVFLDKVTEEVKLVGVTVNCGPKYHLQSMIWATDAIGVKLLLYPSVGSSESDKYGTPEDLVALEGCYADMHKAIHGEIGATKVIQNAGYKIDALMAAFHKTKDYQEACAIEPIEDILWNGHYYGTNVHPYETIFIKANRDIDPTLMRRLTDWHLGGTFKGSWDVC